MISYGWSWLGQPMILQTIPKGHTITTIKTFHMSNTSPEQKKIQIPLKLPCKQGKGLILFCSFLVRQLIHSLHLVSLCVCVCVCVRVCVCLSVCLWSNELLSFLRSLDSFAAMSSLHTGFGFSASIIRPYGYKRTWKLSTVSPRL